MTRSRRFERVGSLLAVVLPLVAWVAGCEAGPDAELEPLRVGVITLENQGDTANRHGPLVDYLERTLGRPVEMREANDYAAVVEAMKSKRVDLAYFGPASYARAWMVTGGRVTPLVCPVDLSGKRGYRSAVVVKADSGYWTLDDLRGKSFAFVDPNSTSGFQAIHFFLTREGYPPETFFGETGFSGSHDSGVLAVVNGSYDAAATWWESKDYNSFKRMELKGMVDASQLRVIWKSPWLPDLVWTAHADLPAALRDRIKQAFVRFKDDDPEGWRRLTDGEVGGFVETSHEEYADVVEMLRANQEVRRNAP